MQTPFSIVSFFFSIKRKSFYLSTFPPPTKYIWGKTKSFSFSQPDKALQFLYFIPDIERIHQRCWDRGGICNKSILCGGKLIWYKLLLRIHHLMKWRVHYISWIFLWWTGKKCRCTCTIFWWGPCPLPIWAR